MTHRVSISIVFERYRIANLWHCFQSDNTLDYEVRWIGLNLSLYCCSTKFVTMSRLKQDHNSRVWRVHCRSDEILSPFSQQGILWRNLTCDNFHRQNMVLTCLEISVPSPDILACANAMMSILLESRKDWLSMWFESTSIITYAPPAVRVGYPCHQLGDSSDLCFFLVSRSPR